MSKVAELEAELVKLSPDELRQIRGWLDELLEDELEFTPAFEAAIRESEREMAAGLRPRVRQP
jgi:hypothetical protein